MGFRVPADVLLQEFARVADGGEQENSGNKAKKLQAGLRLLDLGVLAWGSASVSDIFRSLRLC